MKIIFNHDSWRFVIFFVGPERKGDPRKVTWRQNSRTAPSPAWELLESVMSPGKKMNACNAPKPEFFLCSQLLGLSAATCLFLSARSMIHNPGEGRVVKWQLVVAHTKTWMALQQSRSVPKCLASAVLHVKRPRKKLLCPMVTKDQLQSPASN